MRAHVAELCKRHRIEIRHTGFGDEYADFDTRSISIPGVLGPSSYITALHEIAHIVHKPARYPSPGKGYRRGVLEAEVAAWTWAIRRSRVPLPHWVFQRIATCLAEYKGRTGPDL